MYKSIIKNVLYNVIVHQVGHLPRVRRRWFDSVDRAAERMSKCSTGEGQQKTELHAGGE